MKDKNTLYYIYKELRVNHWIKNILIFTPLFFSGNLLNSIYYFDLIIGFLAFSFVASSVYIINDLFDVEKDKKHPKKKYRPIASWKISVKNAYLLIFIIWMLWFLMAFFVDIYFLILLLLYFISNLIYSTYTKHIAILDIFFVSIMYFLRILWWALIINVDISSWIFITIFFWSMFLISAKRYAELISDTIEKRKVLEFYNEKVLESIFLISMSSSLISYIMYTVSKWSIYFYSVIFITYIFIKYIHLVFWEWKWEEPEIILIKDLWIVISIILWSIFSIYFYYI